ncbi:sporulation protein [Romboutsia sp.]|uniref:sporulation protein n=1 Tax=Romboutsia sp. TaxID=1965302 RepID=UPI003F4074A2
MSFLKKAMANVLGIGGTKVDTVLSNTSVIPGGKIEGMVNIYGGEIEQQLQCVYIDVKTSYEKEYDDRTTTVEAIVQRFTVDINKTISPNESFNIPFSFDLDLNCPITLGSSKVWVSTQLDIEKAIDHTDGDGIKINPTNYMNTIFKAVEELGFRMQSAKNIYDKHRFSYNKFVQEFEFIPTSGAYRGKLDELEVILIANANGVRIILEVDRKVRGLGSLISEQLSLDETLVRIDFSYSDLSNKDYISNELHSLIKKYC